MALCTAWAAVGVLVILARPAGATLVRGRVILHGARKTTPEYVEARTQIRAGDVVTFESLKQAEASLIASDLFRSASVTVALPRGEAARLMYVDPEPHPIDIEVTLEEKMSWIIFPNAAFGGGDEAFGVVYAEQNFRGDGIQLLAAGQLGEQRSFGFVGLRDPHLFWAPLSYAVGVIARDESIRFFDQHREIQETQTFIAGGEGQIGWVSTPHFRTMFGTLYHRQWLDPAKTFAHALVPENTRQGNIVALQLLMLYDNTTAPEGLRRGAAVTLRNEIADNFWYSDFDYFKLDFFLELYGYFRKTYPSVLFRSVLAYPTSERGVPLTEIVRAGGPDLRGYLNNEFHGDTLITLQLEEQVPFAHVWKVNLAAALFADAGALLERHPGGTVTTDPILKTTPKLSDFHTSVGAGLRIVVPGVAIPAMRLDVAYGIDVDDYAIVFSIARGAL